MMTKKQLGLRGIPLLVLTYTTFLLLFTTCMSVDDDYSNSKLAIIAEGGIRFDSYGDSKTFEIETNGDWSVKIESGAEWLSVNPMKGTKKTKELTVNVKKNEGDTRKGTLIVTSSSIDKTITVTQIGKDVQSFEFVTIKDIRDMYTESGRGEMIIDEPLMLKAVVISDREGANRSSKRDGYIQDSEGYGLAFRVTQSETPFNMGDELIINLQDAKIHYFDYAGILQIVFSKMDAQINAQNVTVSPKEVTIKTLHNGMYDGTLVRIKDVQFEDYKGLNYYAGEGNATSRLLACVDGGTIEVKTTKNANFKNRALPAGKGSIVGIASFCKENWELQMRNHDDAKGMSNDESTRFNAEDTNYITINQKKVTFEAKGGEATIGITSNVNWEVLCNASWLSINPTNGENDGEVVIVVSENKDDERTSTITITDGEIAKTIAIVQKGEELEVETDVCNELFFSEYVEGSSYNKYLEIYNGTGKSVDLSDYIIEVYINGQPTPKYTEMLDGVLKNNEVLVIAHSKATIYNGAVYTSTVANFNGNDAIALIKIVNSNFKYIDIIGCIGENPGKEWMDTVDKNLSTLDKTLVRKASVRGGVTKNPEEGFPTLGTEWISYPIDTSKYLGRHTMD